MTNTLQVNDRERTASRLLKSSAKNSYDPEVDIDWDAPLAEDKPYLPFHRSTLYGTRLWEELTEQQRIELTKHEFASLASNGLWFEVLLMQILLKDFYRRDPRTNHAQYALTEIADECRHSTMFAKTCERIGAPAYGPFRILHQGGRLLPAALKGPSAYASILVAEEILDRIQRDQMHDEQVQPLVRMVNRIHVVEEARHVTFAREEVIRGMRECGPAERAHHQFMTALVGFCIVKALINPRIYEAVGLRPGIAYRVAMENPHWRETIRWSGEKIMAFLDESGLVGGPGMPLWRKAGLIR
ncbi:MULTISPECIES: diiron oxygenase [unclassified Actinopolyspora]|uniref:AurF N-oxygenase family protein n=1 Tax=unclassified Actinopolyspora TaxID=2639451 RepID=UPI0013F67300|nr:MULTISPECIES: diiron oxygenase [unclassified Actinopolyspora]NHD17968.1 diiron oxygenase [Actinopolyspora sp. BKK2]NHE77841.1 diiron oxygenase [Actinopolyspora sp. BKK1]